MDNESHRASVGVDRAPKFGKESNSLKLTCCAKKQNLVDSCQIFDLDDGSQQNTVESRMSCSNLEGTKKRCVYIESSKDAVSMSNCKRLRKGDINVEDSAHSDSSKSDQEFLGGILTARKNRFNIPRCRLRELQIIHFKDMDQTPPLEVEGCLSWAKIILRHYHSVRRIVVSEDILRISVTHFMRIFITHFMSMPGHPMRSPFRRGVH